MDLMEEARKEGLGIWNPKAADKDKVRTVHVLDKDARKFYDSHKRQKLKGIIEQVRDGSSLRVEALVQDEKSEGPQYVSMLVHIAGIACPRIPRPYSVLYEQYLKAKETDPSKEPPVEEKAVPYGAEAKFFTEIRLLHRDVEVELLAVDKQNNIFATVLVPEGNIAVSLLKNGFARIVEWSANATPYKALLEAAETEAKKRRVCLWHSYVEEEHVVAKKDFTGRVVQIISGDTVMVEDSSGYPVRISLASVRAPKIGIRGSKNEPFALEAKEFLRKSLIGHKVRVLVEYVRSSDSKDGDRVYGTIFYNKKNISVELVVSGLASVQSHRMDEDRSIHYDELLAAESKAEKTKKGKFSKSVPVPAAVIDLCERPKSVSREEGAEEGSASSKKSPLVNVKAKQYLPFLMKSKRLDAVVEYVFSGHRFKLYVPSENCVCFFSLAAVKSPASSGKTPEPYATEALNFAKSHILQHDVQIEVEGLDKGGNFLGHIFLNRRNFGIELLHAGLARLFPPAADRSEYRDVLYKAQDDAKSAKLNIWKDWVEPKEEEKKPVAEEEVEEKEVSTSAPKELKIRICDITDPTSFYFYFLGDRAGKSSPPCVVSNM
jgi:staphylococcal nuclease domain-containing protein 1